MLPVSGITVSHHTKKHEEGVFYVQVEVITDNMRKYCDLTISPCYVPCPGLSDTKLSVAIKSALHAMVPPESHVEWIPSAYFLRQTWPSFFEALKMAHSPTSKSHLSVNGSVARARLSFDVALAAATAAALGKGFVEPTQGIFDEVPDAEEIASAHILPSLRSSQRDDTLDNSAEMALLRIFSQSSLAHLNYGGTPEKKTKRIRKKAAATEIESSTSGPNAGHESAKIIEESTGATALGDRPELERYGIIWRSPLRRQSATLEVLEDAKSVTGAFTTSVESASPTTVVATADADNAATQVPVERVSKRGEGQLWGLIRSHVNK